MSAILSFTSICSLCLSTSVASKKAQRRTLRSVPISRRLSQRLLGACEAKKASARFRASTDFMLCTWQTAGEQAKKPKCCLDFNAEAPRRTTSALCPPYLCFPRKFCMKSAKYCKLLMNGACMHAKLQKYSPQRPSGCSLSHLTAQQRGCRCRSFRLTISLLRLLIL